MDAKARRQFRRRWKALHQDEIVELISWIHQPEVWCVNRIVSDDLLEAVPEKRCFFNEGTRTRKGWIEFLRQYNIHVELV